MTAVIILAAGASGRLGQPKQNLLFNGKTLLQQTVAVAQEANCGPVIVVLGANSDQIQPILGVATLYNDEWEEGMASSIRIAIEHIEKGPNIDGAIIMVCDQPFVTASLLNSMIRAKVDTGSEIVACAYHGTAGVPALFGRALFAELLALKGEEGAKNLLKSYTGHVATVAFEQGSVDIDTPDDYKRLMQ